MSRLRTLEGYTLTAETAVLCAMRALGGEVVLTDSEAGIRGAISKAEELAGTIDGACVLQQFRNKSNSQTHYETTAPEIWEQMDGRVDAWVAGSGSSGTFTGVARFLKERNPSLQLADV